MANLKYESRLKLKNGEITHDEFERQTNEQIIMEKLKDNKPLRVEV